MKTFIPVFEKIRQTIALISQQLRFSKFLSKVGRKLALSIEDSISLALFKQKQGIETKKSVYDIFKPDCSYKTLVVSIKRWLPLAAVVLVLILKANRRQAHVVKHTDTTDLPVCQMKNVDSHKTMKGLATLSKNSKGWFYGLKLHLTSDLNQQVLAVRLTTANVDDRKGFIPLNKEMDGIFIADSGYISEKLQRQFYQEGKRILFVKPYKTMRKLATAFELWLYGTRMRVEINFRNLKLFHGLVTSLPRSVDGYLANYIYSLLAYLIA